MTVLPFLSPLDTKCFTPAAAEILGRATIEAEATGYKLVKPEHLFLSILASGSKSAARIFGRATQQVNSVREMLRSDQATRPMENRKPYRGVEKSLSRSAELVLRRAIRRAREFSQYAVGTDHLVLALLEERAVELDRILERLQLEPQRCLYEVTRLLTERGPR